LQLQQRWRSRQTQSLAGAVAEVAEAAEAEVAAECIWEAVEAGKEELPTRRAEPLQLELQSFLDACSGRAPNPVPVADGVRALAVVEAAALAARLGRTVAL